MNEHVESSELAAEIDGETSRNRSEAIRVHLAGCESCRSEYHHLEGAAQALAGDDGPQDERFVPELMARMDATPSRRWVPVAGLAAAGVCAVVAMMIVPTELTAPNRPDFVARGGSAAADNRLGLVVRVHRASTREGVTLAPGARLRAGDGLSFETTWRGEAGRYLMLFAVDAAGELHWFYPAYLSAAEDPASIALPPGRRALPEGVHMDAPAAGKLEIVALSSAERLHVRAVEASYAAGGLEALGSLGTLLTASTSIEREGTR